MQCTEAKNIQPHSFTEEEIINTFDKTRMTGSQKLFEPATTQKREVEEAEKQEDEKLAASGNQEPIDNKVNPRACKKIFLELRKLHTFYNPILEYVGNSELAEFLYLSTGIKIKSLKLSMRHGFMTILKKNLVGEMLLRKS